MRTLVFGGAIIALVLALSACGGSSESSATDQAQHDADTYAISQIEEKFHESMSKKDIDQLMSLWAPDATFTFGPGKTAAGIQQIRGTWLKSTGVQAGDTLGLRPPRVEDARHGQRRPGDAAFRMPLHRRQEREGGSDHGRGHGRRKNRRSLVDHQDGRRDRGIEPLSPCPKVTRPRTSRERQSLASGVC